VANLRCQIDLSFQYDEDKTIDYSFCSSNSTMLFRDKLEYKAQPNAEKQDVVRLEVREPEVKGEFTKPKYDKLQVQNEQEATSKKTVKEQINVHNNTTIRIVKYTDKSFILYGDTKPYADELRKIKGLFSYYLKEGAGWIFSSKKEVAVRMALKSVLPEEPCVFEENIMPSGRNTPKPYKISEDTYSVVSDSDWVENELTNASEVLSGSRLPVEYQGYDSIEKYLQAFSKMKTVMLRGLRGPHKAILLLAIFKGIKEGWIQGNKIHISPELINAFFEIWDRYVPNNWPFICNARQPYIHLASDGFYHLNIIKRIIDINISWSVPDIMRHCKYAYLDTNLYRYAKNELLRKEMQDFLIEKYIYDQMTSIK
jgi:hypothetical protein